MKAEKEKERKGEREREREGNGEEKRNRKRWRAGGTRRSVEETRSGGNPGGTGVLAA